MCKNCFNGCGVPTSDKCIKYTGPDIELLGIDNGDTLLHVEEQIFLFIQNIISGQGVIPTISEEDICELIESNLPDCGSCTEITLNAILEALIKSVCQIADQVTALEAAVDVIEADYTISCLEGVSPDSGTHAILQAAITKICEIDGAREAFITYVGATYVTIATINDYIESYITNSESTTIMAAKMLPFTAMAYFGPLNNFDLTGAGIGDWDKVYLCNGQNGTPDLRGRTLVGATTMGNTAMSPVVDPLVVGNPSYALHTISGTNNVILSDLQIPSHNHDVDVTIVSSISPNPHNHGWTGDNGNGNPDGSMDSTGSGSPASYPRLSKLLDVNLTVNSVATVTETNVGGGQGHTNIQPSYASYWVIYIP